MSENERRRRREVLRGANLALRFFLEVAALVAVAYWGATANAPASLRLVFAVAAPVIVAVLWGLFISPKARFSSGRAGQVGLGLIVFAAAAGALYLRGHRSLALAFGITAAASSAILSALPQPNPGQG